MCTRTLLHLLRPPPFHRGHQRPCHRSRSKKLPPFGPYLMEGRGRKTCQQMRMTRRWIWHREMLVFMTSRIQRFGVPVRALRLLVTSHLPSRQSLRTHRRYNRPPHLRRRRRRHHHHHRHLLQVRRIQHDGRRLWGNAILFALMLEARRR